jgi:hypothetical protein
MQKRDGEEEVAGETGVDPVEDFEGGGVVAESLKGNGDVAAL